MSFIQSPLAIVDLEFTSVDPLTQEIIEIGALMIDQEKMEILREFEMKVAPSHIETADPESLKVNGYKEELWQGATPIGEALNKLTAFVGNESSKLTTFSGWNIPLDWTFLAMAFRAAGKPIPFDYHTFDIRAVAAEFLKRESNIPKITLATTSIYLGFDPEPLPHRAVNGARQAFLVLKKLRELGV